MAEISIHMPEQSGQTGQTLWLRNTSDGTLLNAGGDALAESPASSGRFVATVAEAIAETVHCSVVSGSLTVRDGWLAVGDAVVRDAYPSSSGGGGDAEQATLEEVQDAVDGIALSLSGTRINVTSRVSGSTITAYMGDDFKVRSLTQLPLTVNDTGGALRDKLVAIGLTNLSFGASRANAAAGEITGTIPAITYASNITTIKVEITACANGLQPDNYLYQIQSTQTHSSEKDDYIELEGTLIVKQRTVAPLG